MQIIIKKKNQKPPSIEIHKYSMTFEERRRKTKKINQIRMLTFKMAIRNWIFPKRIVLCDMKQAVVVESAGSIKLLCKVFIKNVYMGIDDSIGKTVKPKSDKKSTKIS